MRLSRGQSYTPGELTKLVGVELDQLGPIVVGEGEAHVDVLIAAGRTARASLERVGPTRLEGWTWRWLRLASLASGFASLGGLALLRSEQARDWCGTEPRTPYDLYQLLLGALLVVSVLGVLPGRRARSEVAEHQ